MPKPHNAAALPLPTSPPLPSPAILCTKRRTTSRRRRCSACPAPQTAIHAPVRGLRLNRNPGNPPQTPPRGGATIPVSTSATIRVSTGLMAPLWAGRTTCFISRPPCTRNAALRLDAVTVVRSQHRRRRFTPHHSIPAQTTPGPRTWDLTVLTRPHTQHETPCCVLVPSL